MVLDALVVVPLEKKEEGFSCKPKVSLWPPLWFGYCCIDNFGCFVLERWHSKSCVPDSFVAFPYPPLGAYPALKGKLP